MCLTSSQREPKIAERPITVYKLIEKKDGSYFTPCEHTQIENDVINGEKPFVAEGEKEIGTLTTIGGGYIHSYTSVMRVTRCDKNHCIFECEIPAGTKYWAGSDDNTEYASEQILFKKALYEPFVSNYSAVLKEAAAFGELTDDNSEELIDFWGKRCDEYILKAAAKLDPKGVVNVFQKIAIKYVENGYEDFISKINKRTNVVVFDELKLLAYAVVLWKRTNDINIATDISKIYKTVQDIYNAVKENNLWGKRASNPEVCWRDILLILPEVITNKRNEYTDTINERNLEASRNTVKEYEKIISERDTLLNILIQ